MNSKHCLHIATIFLKFDFSKKYSTISNSIRCFDLN